MGALKGGPKVEKALQMMSMGLGLLTCACMHFPSSLVFMLPLHGFLNWGRIHIIPDNNKRQTTGADGGSNLGLCH